MKYINENNILTLYLEGELNSTNAEEIDNEIDNIVKGQDFDELILDFLDLNYVSSAGLRIVLKLKQHFNNVSITNVNLEVYDILTMTGFTNFMNIKKALKQVSVEGCPVIGEGFTSTVYRLNKDTIIKVFNRTTNVQEIERELKLAKQAFILGIPTAISFDIVKVDDKLGVRFEMLDCQSLKNAFINEKDHYDALAKKYASILKKINTTECFDDDVPDAKKEFLQKLEYLKPYFKEDLYLKTKDLLEKIPDSNTFVHGDCHFKNIMVQGDDFLIIDMDTLSRGYFIFELAAIRATYVAFDEDDPGNSERFLGVSNEFTKKLFNDILTYYFGKLTDDMKDKIALLCYLHMLWWTKVNEGNNDRRFSGCMERFLKLLPLVDSLEIR